MQLGMVYIKLHQSNYVETCQTSPRDQPPPGPGQWGDAVLYRYDDNFHCNDQYVYTTHGYATKS